MKSFLQFIKEAASPLPKVKGFINIDGKRAVLKKYNSRLQPYHTQMVINDPKAFGLTEKKIIKIIEKGIMHAYDDPAAASKNIYRDLKTGDDDINMDIISHLRKAGWYEIYIEKDGAVKAENLRDDASKNVHKMAKILEAKFRLTKNFPHNAFAPKVFIRGHSNVVEFDDVWVWQRYLLTGDLKKAEDPMTKVAGASSARSITARFR